MKILSWMKSYLKEQALPTVPNTIVGYLILVFFLWCLSCFCPSCYRALTRWANQENLPTVNTCHITDLSEMENKYKWYNVKISLENSSYTSFSRLGFYIEPESGIFIDPELRDKTLPRERKPNYIFLKNYKKDTHEIHFIAMTMKNNNILEQYVGNAISSEECPFTVQIYGSK